METPVHAQSVSSQVGSIARVHWSRPLSIALICWVVAADILIFRHPSYVSLAVFALLSPLIFRIASDKRPRVLALSLTGALLAAIAIRLVWQGHPTTVISALVLIVACSMAASGVRPWVIEGLRWILDSSWIGAIRFAQVRVSPKVVPPLRAHHGVSAVLVPMLTVGVFGTLFIAANPNLVDLSFRWIGRFNKRVFEWLGNFSMWELPFCIIAGILGLGLMRPLIRTASALVEKVNDEKPSALYAAYRNTLFSVAALFALYLGFEFLTLWRRDFPDGFYYAGYAHQGAAWLTIALMLATGLLSIIFGRSLKHDSRRHALKRLALLWSAENFLLAMAVYNRLAIYVDYNGLTRMRIVGFFGITAVVIGFALVVIKIQKEHSFRWLIRNQLVALAVVMIVHSATPSDTLSHAYNRWCVQNTDEAPSVMLAVKPLSDEGYLQLFPLLDHPDALIRRGVQARLLQRMDELEREPVLMGFNFQGSTQKLRQQFESLPNLKSVFPSITERQKALQAWKNHAMQWY